MGIAQPHRRVGRDDGLGWLVKVELALLWGVKNRGYTRCIYKAALLASLTTVISVILLLIKPLIPRALCPAAYWLASGYVYLTQACLFCQ
ncbi:hypothetical protein BHM03_00022435 [Ensete ventricosum]|nr:hypothetical protein BHM03_00022435 [Ensete ventricosum]